MEWSLTPSVWVSIAYYTVKTCRLVKNIGLSTVLPLLLILSSADSTRVVKKNTGDIMRFAACADPVIKLEAEDSPCYEVNLKVEVAKS